MFFNRLLSRLLVIGDRIAVGVKGFTLIELLISMLITTVIISTLLAFTVNIMQSDRQEQAKAESQSDVQSALNYISNDLQEAVYIYNADSLNYNSTDAAPGPGIRDQLPNSTVDQVFNTSNSTPVLVFWKRKYFAPDADVTVSGNVKKVGCLEYGITTSNNTPTPSPTTTPLLPITPVPTPSPAPNANCDGGSPLGSGRYTYALVAYYLIYDNPNGANSTWSNAARVGRWELSDGIQASCQNSDITTCPNPRPVARVNVTATTAVNYWTLPDQGFSPFNTTGGLIDALMNKWTKSPDAYASSNVPKILVDFIDDSPYSTDQDDGSSSTPAGKPAIKILVGPNTTDATTNRRQNADCLDANKGVGSSSTVLTETQRIPSTFTVGAPSSFYVCVNRTQNSARIYLRGNAVARLKPKQTESLRRVLDADSSYLSTNNIRAFGRGKVTVQ